MGKTQVIFGLKSFKSCNLQGKTLECNILGLSTKPWGSSVHQKLECSRKTCSRRTTSTMGSSTHHERLSAATHWARAQSQTTKLATRHQIHLWVILLFLFGLDIQICKSIRISLVLYINTLDSFTLKNRNQ
jgi:hypothetical protein